MTESYLLKVVWGGIDVSSVPLNTLLETAGLADMDRGNVPVPFPMFRRMAKSIGIKPRMPAGESEMRIRSIVDNVNVVSLQRFAQLTYAHGSVPMVLGLNAVIDDVPSDIPNHRVMQEVGLPVMDLFDIFPKSERAALRVRTGDDHPNAEGHRRTANRFYAEIVTFIESGEYERVRSNANISDRRRF